MHKIWIIGLNVFRQLMRNRILAVMYLFGLCLIGIAAFLGDLGQEAELRLVRDFGLMAVEWAGFVTVLLCHVVLLFEETELRTISILFVKPITRSEYMLGKVFGSLLLLAMNQISMLILLAGLGWLGGFSGAIDGPLLLAALYLFLGCALFSIVAVFFSIFASTVPACAAYAGFTFFLGHFTGNLLEWVKRMDKPQLVYVVKTIYYIMPNFSIFNLKDNLEAVALHKGNPESLQAALLWPLAYLACYGGAVLYLALWNYERKEY